MQGNIKFIDSKTGKWGFIIPDDGSADVHFKVKDVVGSHMPTQADANCPVNFEVSNAGGRIHATHITLLATTPDNEPERATPTRRQEIRSPHKLDCWAFIPYALPISRDHSEYDSAFHLLADVALEERWFFGKDPDIRKPYPILVNYIRYTFVRLKMENKVFEEKEWACFNTGLVDRLYDPIFALFKTNPRKVPQWEFYDFCIPGKGSSGKKLTSIFAPLPEPPQYFSSNFDMLLDTAQEIHVDYEHVIYDGIERDRFPVEFVMQHIPRDFKAEDYSNMEYAERIEYLKSLRMAVEKDLQCTRSIKNRLEDAKTLAEKRTRWNFKTAIPQYYPAMNSMSLLLPLALVNDEVVDIALVVTRNPSGSYQGRTVLPLAWAYQHARLVCRPDSDWLTPDRVSYDNNVEGAEE